MRDFILFYPKKEVNNYNKVFNKVLNNNCKNVCGDPPPIYMEYN